MTDGLKIIGEDIYLSVIESIVLNKINRDDHSFIGFNPTEVEKVMQQLASRGFITISRVLIDGEIEDKVVVITFKGSYVIENKNQFLVN